MPELFALTPFVVLTISIVVLLLLAAFYRNHLVACCVSFIGLLSTFISVFYISPNVPDWANTIITIDKISALFTFVILGIAMLVNVLSYSYFNKFEEQKEEFYVLFNVAVLGTLVVTMSTHFIGFFIGLELLSIPLYVMIAYLRNRPESIEAAIKYLILASASTAILLFGMALVYAAFGSMDIRLIILFFKNSSSSALAYSGISLLLVAFGFKLAVAPFHMWIPDVYQGAPTPVTAFLATASKGAIFIFAFKLLGYIKFETAGIFFVALSVISVLSMFTGNLLALRQNSIRRVLACSSIAHFGYLLIALIAGDLIGSKAASFYLITYFISIVGAFTVLALLSKDKEIDLIDDLKGLYFRNKWLAIALTIMLFSLAGLPLTAGFMSKFYLATVAIHSSIFILIWFLIINSAISLYYYLKVVFVMFKPEEQTDNTKLVLPISGSIILSLTFIANIWIGINPQSLFKIIELFVK